MRYTATDMTETRARKTYRENDLAGVELEDVCFETCQFVATNLTGTRMNGATFAGCKFLNVDFRRCKGFLDMRFENSIFDNCNFSDLTLKQQTFVGCELRRCTFVHTNLTAADFSHSDLSETLFHDCDLTRADFSRARNYAIDPTGNKVSKAKFSLPEAVSLLRGFDILLRE